jgi:hypothetical protein
LFRHGLDVAFAAPMILVRLSLSMALCAAAACSSKDSPSGVETPAPDAGADSSVDASEPVDAHDGGDAAKVTPTPCTCSPSLMCTGGTACDGTPLDTCIALGDGSEYCSKRCDLSAHDCPPGYECRVARFGKDGGTSADTPFCQPR